MLVDNMLMAAVKGSRLPIPDAAPDDKVSVDSGRAAVRVAKRPADTGTGTLSSAPEECLAAVCMDVIGGRGVENALRCGRMGDADAAGEPGLYLHRIKFYPRTLEC